MGSERRKQLQERVDRQRQLARKQHLKKLKPKIESRQRKAQSKVVENLNAERVKKQVRENRKKVLENVVGNYSSRPNPERDFGRMIRDTQSKINRDKSKKVETLFQVHSHSNEQLMRNLNFRLQVYLFEKGILSSPIAHQLVNNLDNRPENRIF